MARAKLACTVLLSCCALLATAGSCERVRPDPEPYEETETNGSAPDANLESEGEPCDSDPDCSSYLRCPEGTCRIPPAIDGKANEETPRVRFHEGTSEEDVVRYYVELATTRPERRRGLMFRPSMQSDWGMLFVYDEAKKRSFWMKNTYISLDIVFMDETGEVVHVVHEAEPETTAERPSRKPARFALELNAGTAERDGIEAGDQMTVENIPDRHAPEP